MDDLVRVVGYTSERQATATATDLVARGIGASVRDDRPTGAPPDVAVTGTAPGSPGEAVQVAIGESLTERPNPPAPIESPFGVYVVAADRVRALELLGLRDEREAQVDEVSKAKSSAPPLKILVPVVLAAFIIIPTSAFFITYWLSGG